MKKIKLDLKIGHSGGRGVGFYSQFLSEYLRKTNQIELTDQNPDLIHYPFFDLFYPTLPFQETKPTVVTVHDLTPLVLKSFYPKGLKGSLNLFRQKLALKKVDAIITDSVNSKQDIVRFFKIPEDKIFVIYLAADPVFSQKPSAEEITLIKKKYQLPDRFVLYVGGVNANKNLVELAKSCKKLNIPLVLVGSEFTKSTSNSQKVHPELAQFEDLKKIINGDPLFYKLGFVPTNELNAIYRLATFYCQPSLYEGFGLPILEAMAAECLVVSSNTSSLPEIYADNSISFNPTEKNALTTALKNALKLTPAQKDTKIEAGKQKAKDFSWERTARETLAIYGLVLNRL